MRRTRQETRDVILVVRSNPLNPTSAAALCPVRIRRHPFDVATACQRDDDILFRNQIFVFEFDVVHADFRPTFVVETFFQLFKFCPDQIKQDFLTRKDAVQFRDQLHDFVILCFNFFPLKTCQAL